MIRCPKPIKRFARTIIRQRCVLYTSKYYKYGHCARMENCNYAHSQDDIRQQPNLEKTRMCPALNTGECRASNCKFAHHLNELRHTDALFKTAMCIQYAKGRCTAGAMCRFAHSIDELRTHDDNHKTVVNEHKPNTVKFAAFEEDKQTHIERPKPPQTKTSTGSNNLRKIVHSSDYEENEELAEHKPVSTCDPTHHRYNYLNPFYFYSFNNFPVYYPASINQPLPFFNYISINNNSNNQPNVTIQYKNSEESSQFNSKSSEEDKAADKSNDTELKCYNTVEDDNFKSNRTSL